MRRMGLMVVFVLLGIVGAMASPANAQLDSCVLSGDYALAASLVGGTEGQILGTLTFTPPGTCSPGAAGAVTLDLSLLVPGSSVSTPVSGTLPYTVSLAGALDIGPGVLHGAVGHLAGIANSVVFGADAALAPPTIRLAGTAVSVTFKQIASSRRFKTDVRDMGEASRGLLRLRPVMFRYTRPAADGSHPLQYGLIAEEVMEVYPELVGHDPVGRPETVRYELLPAMVLNELQAQHRVVQAQEQRIGALEAQLAELAAQLKRLELRDAGT